MTPSKFDIEKLTLDSVFKLWKIEMQASLDNVLGDKNIPTKMSEKDKSDLLKGARSVIVLGDGVLREVLVETKFGLFQKLEGLFMQQNP